jgi:hypothetical protein
MSDDWKKSFQGAAARAQVEAYFTRCERLVEARNLDEAEHCLSRGRWRFALDLNAVPKPVVDATDGLCADAVGLIEYRNPEAINLVVRKILALWQVAATSAVPSEPSAADQLMM